MSVEQYRGDMEMCCRCSACKHIPLQMVKNAAHSYACPSISRFNFHAYSGSGRLITGRDMLNTGFKFTDKMQHIIYNCQMCGACDISCKYAMDMEVLAPINEIRIKAVKEGHTNAGLEKVIGNLHKTNSMVPVKGKRGDWAQGLGIKNAAKEKVDVLYHVGCVTSFDPKMQKLAKATAKILQKAGVNFGIAGDAEVCCGGRAYQMGYEDDFLAQAKKNIALIKKAGVKTLVTGCADGYQAFKVLYDKFNLKGELEVLHITEYIAKLIKEGKLKLNKKVNLNVTYHDPCYLGRLGEPWIHWEGKRIPGYKFVFDPPKTYRRGTYGVYDAPRGVLAAISGVKLTEMDRIKEYTWCGGAGGGVNDSNPDFMLWTAKHRIEEAESTGAEALVSACPWCESTFDKAIKETGSNLKVYDIVELVAKAI